jgi:hypothetical protein
VSLFVPLVTTGSVEYFASAASEPGQIAGYAEARRPFGVTASKLRPASWPALEAASKRGVRVFVDSGAFARDGAREVNWSKILEAQTRIARMFKQNAIIVAPDVPGDPAATLELLHQHVATIKRWTHLGAEVIVVVQDIDRPRNFWLQTSFIRSLKQPIVAGWPTRRKTKPGKLEELVSAFRPGGTGKIQPFSTAMQTYRPPRIHLMGLGPTGRYHGASGEAIAQTYPEIKFSADAAERSRLVGSDVKGGRRLTAVERRERRQLGETDYPDTKMQPASTVAKMPHFAKSAYGGDWIYPYIAYFGASRKSQQSSASRLRSVLKARKPSSWSKGLRASMDKDMRAWARENLHDEDVGPFLKDPAAWLAWQELDAEGTYDDDFNRMFQQLRGVMFGQEVKFRGVVTTSKPQKMPLVILGCGNKKLETRKAVRADQLYTGGVFRAHHEIAATFGGVDYIVSAKHGLIPRTREILPYDLALSDLNPGDRKEWAQKVAEDVCRVAQEGAKQRRVVFLGGKAYAAWIPLTVKRCGLEVEQPLEGLSVGLRRRAAKRIRDGETPPSSRSWRAWLEA